MTTQQALAVAPDAGVSESGLTLAYDAKNARL